LFLLREIPHSIGLAATSALQERLTRLDSALPYDDCWATPRRCVTGSARLRSIRSASKLFLHVWMVRRTSRFAGSCNQIANSSYRECDALSGIWHSVELWSKSGLRSNPNLVAISTRSAPGLSLFKERPGFRPFWTRDPSH
jgi:hypothetical protein